MEPNAGVNGAVRKGRKVGDLEEDEGHKWPGEGTRSFAGAR